MPHDPHAAIDPNDLPRPAVTVTPATSAYPAEGGVLDLLVEVSVELPVVSVDRKPLALALVIDHSGSMGGAPLDGAKQAAEQAVAMLMPGDWVSVVIYDDTVDVVVPAVQVGADRRALVAAIRTIRSGGSTALHAGWTEGVTQVFACPADTVKRVVILTDGLANVGVTDATAIAEDVRRAASTLQVTTTALGFGRGYDELLLRAMADAGNGNYAFIEGAGQIVTVFEHELAGLGALRGRSVRLGATSGGVRLRAVGEGAAADAHGVVLPDLVAGLPIEVLVEAELDAGAEAPTLELRWEDVFTGRHDAVEATVDVVPASAQEVAGLPIERRVAQMRTLIEIAASKSRVAEAARRHDHAEAQRLLDGVAVRVEHLPSGPERDREAQYLERLRQQLQERDFVMTSKSAMSHAYDRERGRHDEKLMAMHAAEAGWRSAKMAGAADAGAAVGSPARVIWERVVARGDGGSATVQVVIGDLTDESTDAIVNSTNRGLFGTTGVDGAIHRRGGAELTAAARAVGGVDHGHAVFTHGFGLPAKYVIHTATTPWKAIGTEIETLERCYASVLTVAERLGVTSIAFPAIGTGAYGYPVDEAARVAVGAVTAWLRGRGTIDLVRFVLVDRASAEAYRTALQTTS
jgi:Ca-activated chloride channel homolog